MCTPSFQVTSIDKKYCTTLLPVKPPCLCRRDHCSLVRNPASRPCTSSIVGRLTLELTCTWSTPSSGRSWPALSRKGHLWWLRSARERDGCFRCCSGTTFCRSSPFGQRRQTRTSAPGTLATSRPVLRQGGRFVDVSASWTVIDNVFWWDWDCSFELWDKKGAIFRCYLRHAIVACLQDAKSTLVAHMNQDTKAQLKNDWVVERAKVLHVFQNEESGTVVITETVAGIKKRYYSTMEEMVISREALEITFTWDMQIFESSSAWSTPLRWICSSLRSLDTEGLHKASLLHL